MDQPSPAKDTDDNDLEDEEANPPGPWQVLLSVAAAAFGVQNSKTRERDFTRGNPLTFILTGLIFTVALVLSLILLVYLVLR